MNPPKIVINLGKVDVANAQANYRQRVFSEPSREDFNEMLERKYGPLPDIDVEQQISIDKLVWNDTDPNIPY